ncbi:MAG TPA: hypothetical protein VFZ42_01810 [Chitinophagaceae bacterium]
MKTFLPLLLILISFTGCKKTIEKIQEDAIIKAMTDGQWKITSFTLNGTDITSSFSTYKFQYYSNKTVDAINNGSVEKTGTWDGDAATMTTSATFNGALVPLSHINGSWHIDNSSWTYVVASQSGAQPKVMRLEKL